MLITFFFSLFSSCITIGLAAQEHDVKIKRSVLKSGFHREVETTVYLSSKLNVEHQRESCAFLLSETLPSGVYADPFQIESLQPFGGPEVQFDRQVDIEAAEFASRPHRLFVFLTVPVGHSHFVGYEEPGVSVSLPFHLRYHRPSTHPAVTHARVTIPDPTLYSNCSHIVENAMVLRAPCDVSGILKCDWTYVPYRKMSRDIKVMVPVGQHKDKPLVIVCTLLTSLIVTGLLIKSICAQERTVSQ